MPNVALCFWMWHDNNTTCGNVTWTLVNGALQHKHWLLLQPGLHLRWFELILVVDMSYPGMVRSILLHNFTNDCVNSDWNLIVQVVHHKCDIAICFCHKVTRTLVNVPRWLSIDRHSNAITIAINPAMSRRHHNIFISKCYISSKITIIN